MLFDCCFLVHRSLSTAARAALCMWHWHRYCPECPGCTLGKFLFQYSVWCQRAQMCPSHSAGSVMWHILYFFDQTLWLLFEGGVYFFGKPGDINNAWIGYVQVWQRQLLDVASSTHILSVLLSAVGMTRTAPVLALVWWLSKIIHMRGRILCLLAMATILLFEGGIYFIQNLWIVQCLKVKVDNTKLYHYTVHSNVEKIQG